MSEQEDVPVCPICGGLCRRDILQTDRSEFARGFTGRYGPWRCDIHGEIKPDWEPVEEDDE